MFKWFWTIFSLGAPDHVVVFKTKVLHFKKTQMEREVQKSAQFPFRGRTEAFRYEIVFRGIQPCFLHGGALSLFSTSQGSDVFEEISGTFCTLWRFHGRFLYFDIGVTEKLQNVAQFEIEFMLNFTMCSADLACLNGSTIQLVLRELLLRISLLGCE